jgi:hypothetical protein
MFMILINKLEIKLGKMVNEFRLSLEPLSVISSIILLISQILRLFGRTTRKNPTSAISKPYAN